MRRALRRALRSLIDAALLAAVIVAPLLAPDVVPAGAQVPAGPPLFETLFNGDFELGPNPTGWERRGGTLEVMETGAGRAAFLRSSTTSTKWIEQPVRIEGGVAYQASARLGTDAGVAGGLVRIAWYASEDGSGSQLATVDSPEVGPAAAPALLSTGSRVAPAEARSARVRLVLRPASAESAALAIDDVTFARVGPPAPTPTPTPTPSPPPDPAAAPVAPPEPSKSPPPPEAGPPPAAAVPAAGGGPAVPDPAAPAGDPPPPGGAPAAGASPDGAPAPTAAPGAGEPAPGAGPAGSLAPSPAGEPAPPFATLVNGGFEEEPALWGWRAQAGAATLVDRDGVGRAAALRSTGTATAWIEQAVRVAGGGWYRASAWLAPGDAADSAWVRIAWYASADASGAQLRTVDSPAVGRGATAEVSLGPVQAPAEAGSARLRVMLRPASAGASLTIDGVSFATGQPPPPGPASAAPRVEPTPTPAPAPAPAPAPVLHGAVFNGAFEHERPLLGWTARGGGTATVREGAGGRSAVLGSTGDATKWIEQLVRVAPGEWYEVTAGLAANAGADSAWIRVAWYASADGAAAQLSTEDSHEVAGGAAGAISTGPVQAPPAANAARVRLMLRPRPGLAAELAIDDVSMRAVPAPPAAPPAPPRSRTPAERARVEPPILLARLHNGDFGGPDGLAGWSARGGRVELRPAAGGGGQSAVLLSTTPASAWLEQRVGVEPGAWYAASAVLRPDDGVATAWLRVAWYASPDASGSQLSTVDSEPVGAAAREEDVDAAAGFVDVASLPLAAVGGAGAGEVTLGPVQAPTSARSARLRLMLRPRTASRAELVVERAEFGAARAPAAPVEERPAGPPLAFESLLNGDFEDPADLAGWSRHGGVAQVATGLGEGRAALLQSASKATKWLEQRVGVTGGAWYALAAWLAPAGDADAAWLRFAWYASDDASGAQIGAADSPRVAGGAPAARVSVEAEAPPAARSARVRVLLRPRDAAPASLAIDDVSLARVVDVELEAAEPAAAPAGAAAARSRATPSRAASPKPELRRPAAELGAAQRLLRITELLPDPVDRPDGDHEWVEVTNLAGWAAPLAGATLRDGRRSIALPDIVLPPGGSVVVAGCCADLGEALVYHPPGGLGIALANAGGRLQLHAADGERLDAVTYGPDGAVAAGDGSSAKSPRSGHSLERVFDTAGVLRDARPAERPTPGRASIAGEVPPAVPAAAPPRGATVAPGDAPRGGAAVPGVRPVHREAWLLLAGVSLVSLAAAVARRARRPRAS